MFDPPNPTLRHQDFACLVAVDPDSALITHVSGNCTALLGHAPDAMLDANARDVLGREVWHSLRNAASRPDFAAGAVPMTGVETDYDGLEMRAFTAGPLHVIEAAPAQPSEFGSTPVLDVLQTAMAQLLPLTSEQALADMLVQLLRHISGYDQVTLWRPDPLSPGQARIRSEAKRASRDSMLGKQIDWADLWRPGQARIDLVADAGAAMVPVVASSDAPVLGDLRHARSRPVPAGQLAQMIHDGTPSLIRLRLSRASEPWGVVECHSAMARRPSSAFLSLIGAVLPFIDVKLQALRSL